MAKLYALLGALVNDSATAGASIPKQASRILLMAVKQKWARAAFLDRLLANVFTSLRKMHGPDFASLFLNAEAHIQHHHTYASKVYDGNQTNPGWYSKTAETGGDPLLFIYRVHDSIVAEMMALKNIPCVHHHWVEPGAERA